MPEVKFRISDGIMTFEANHILIVLTIADLHVEHILYLQQIALIIVQCIQGSIWLAEIASVSLGYRTEIFVDVELRTTDAIFLADQAINQLVIIGSDGCALPES